jgi:Winged helix DNA-binding domain
MDIAYQRLHTQHLLGPRLQRPQDVVQWLTAVQSQDYPGAKWGLAQRLDGWTDSDIDRAFDEGAFLRTHVLRPTWHFVLPEDIRWLLALTAPRIKRTMASYDPGLELDEPTYARTNKVLEKAFRESKNLTRTQLGQALNAAGIRGDTRRLAHIVMRAELDALLCSGPLRGKQHTYALLADRAPNARSLPRDEALAELTRRYFASHGPALLQDFAWWSGLTVADAKTGIEMNKPHLEHETIDGKTYWFAPTKRSRPPSPPKGPAAHLLPNYDEYLIAYKDRSAFFHPALLGGETTFFGEVLRRHILVIDGRVVGGWHSTESRGEVALHVRFLAPLTGAQRSALDEAAQYYGRFVGKTIILREQGA